ncbi:Prion-like-(Q/N-rich) domain-bearing protein 25 [Trichinella sp. T6]|nr:Prion-like-(Q/N-rich) domain-bearing protein 25 [Trichinella sp. T6]
MLLLFNVLLVLLASAVELSCAFFAPCHGPSSMGESCDTDADCTGFGVACVLGKCQCDYAYDVLENDPQTGLRQCVKCMHFDFGLVYCSVPDTIDAPCDDKCRFPLFCDNNRCRCIRSKQEHGQCFVDSQLGQSCKRHIECTLPFSACINKRCDCVQGSVRRGNACYAAAKCPDGSRPGNACTVRTTEVEVLHNVINTAAVLDTCDKGNFCYTVDNTFSGHCCPVTCPLSTKPELDYVCSDRGNERGVKCPSETHFCHRFAGISFSYDVCCRRPCREPKPLYIRGSCYSRAHLGSPCEIDEQCDGGLTMECLNRACSCRNGFKPEPTSHSATETPPMTCVRSNCPSDSLALDTECVSKVRIGEQCMASVQCPPNAHCFRGMCFCQCGFTHLGHECVPDQQVVEDRRPLLPQDNLLGMNKPNGAGSGGNLFQLMNSILQGVRVGASG